MYKMKMMSQSVIEWLSDKLLLLLELLFSTKNLCGQGLIVLRNVWCLVTSGFNHSPKAYLGFMIIKAI